MSQEPTTLSSTGAHEQMVDITLTINKNPHPSSEDEIREAMSGVICRCTGYVRTVEAVLRAAALLRGETVPPVGSLEQKLTEEASEAKLPETFYRHEGGRTPLPPLVLTPPEMAETQVVGNPEVKVDAEKLVRGRPVFTDDIRLEGILYSGRGR